MIEPVYSVSLKHNLVVVKIAGDWDIQADIGYLTLLDETISLVKNAPWALFADLRGWRVSEEVINYKHNKTIQLTRNNQIAECWLVDSEEQGQHIQHHIENTNIPFLKVTTEQEAENWLSQYDCNI
ncbi:hypothetical protein [Pseudoalteromonas sp. MMG024]|uniref:hypothetical protein n=1 Tax=Pseudoalteromonas sp. MMG024 TaxID=2909980 RepID=UPI001F44D2DD|nr:hypothetical protein [Pseudoalteromonas sp. MMG024]MCF6455924.1 hypothetical protein [Pseudoalteromonas sp. MMG024]